MIKMNWPTYAWKIFCNWGKVIDVRTSPKVGLWRTFVIVSDFQDVQVLFDHKPVIVLPLFKFMQRSCSINEEKCRHYPKKGHAKITKVLISYRHSLSRKFDNMESNGFDIEQYWTVGLSWAARRWSDNRWIYCSGKPWDSKWINLKTFRPRCIRTAYRGWFLNHLVTTFGMGQAVDFELESASYIFWQHS